MLRDCFELGRAQWFGMGQVRGSHWPLNGFSQSMTPFVTGHNLEAHPYGSVIKRYWISSLGVAIRVPLNVPLFVSFNSTEKDEAGDGQLCLQAKTNDYPYDAVEGYLPHLDYTLCTGHDMLSLHSEMSRSSTQDTAEKRITEDMPASEVFVEKPIWATNEHSLPIMNESSVVAFADSIWEHGLDPGSILLDSRWESHHGDFSMDTKAFPNPSSFIKVLKNKGFRVLLTVSPFIGIDASGLMDASKNNRVISDPHLMVPLLTQCFGRGSAHMCALLDIVNATTRQWYRKAIRRNVCVKTTLFYAFLLFFFLLKVVNGSWSGRVSVFWCSSVTHASPSSPFPTQHH